jgi:hypothetical protein
MAITHCLGNACNFDFDGAAETATFVVCYVPVS